MHDLRSRYSVTNDSGESIKPLDVNLNDEVDSRNYAIVFAIFGILEMRRFSGDNGTLT